jgi:hypothetical protein
MITYQKNKLKNKTMKTTLLFILLASISFAQDQIETKYFKEFYFLNNDLDLTKIESFYDSRSAMPVLLRYPTKFVFKNQVETKEALNLIIASGIFLEGNINDNFQDLFKIEYLEGRIVSISYTHFSGPSYDEKVSTKINFFYDKKGNHKKCKVDFNSTSIESYLFDFYGGDIYFNPTIDYLCDAKGRIIKSRFIGGKSFNFQEFLTTTTYDQNNNIVKTVQSGGRQSDNDFFGKTEFEYDSQNNKIKETYDAKHLQDTTVLSKKWEYNSQNQRVKEINYTKNNAIRYLEKYDYFDGKLVSDSIFWGMESDSAKFNELRLADVRSFHYDKSGKLRAVLFWNSILALYDYDNNGKIIERDNVWNKDTYDIKGNCISKNASSVIYDEKNRLVNYTTTELRYTISNSIYYFDDQSFSVESLQYRGNSGRNSIHGYQSSNFNFINVNDKLFDKNGNMLTRFYHSRFVDTIDFGLRQEYFYQKNEINDLNQLIKQEWFDEKNKLFFERKYKYDEFGNWIERSEISLKEESKAFRMTRKYDIFNNLIEQNVFDDKNELVIAYKWKFDKNNFLLEFSQFDKNDKTFYPNHGFQKVVYSALQDDNLSGARYFNAEGKEVFSSSATYWQYYK